MNAIVNEVPEIQLPSLADRAMLVMLRLSRWQGYAHDSRITHEIEEKSGVSKLGRFNKKLMKDSKLFQEVTHAWTDVYNFYVGRTVPWFSDGTRMLASDYYMDFMPELTRKIERAQALTDKLASVWQEEVRADLVRLKGEGRLEDYPHDIRTRFGAKVNVLPVPTTGDFRIELDERDRATLDDAIAEVRKGITEHLIGEIKAPITKLITRITEYGQKEGGKLHTSLLDNVLDLAERLPVINIDRSPLIDDLARDLKNIVKPHSDDPSKFKQSEIERQKVKAQLDSLLRRTSALQK